MDRYKMVMKGKQHNVSLMNKNNNTIRSSYSFAEVAAWPPRCYTCGFCNRGFKSAQALGGHMNLHRKDRAMLSPYSLYPKYYTYLSSPSYIETKGSSMSCKRPRLNVSSSSSSTPSLKFSLKPCFQATEMSIGFKGSSSEDLDLELRLGHDPPQVK